ncbi:substrate-binding periplasmic protein [Rugamonas aquatica]|uniref:Transporter substrate-binding domain-containing protein n=1 Tax=Rugamonas aquatica TaxID=2743357 RepID=A0A6A7N121_9BURK|nr:transporter substrate-binding domain-containing protein [Rugamonas aquatica]MQA38610.1 transporter substrate-binding domain-containing protein [Rugamonas aquatica]
MKMSLTALAILCLGVLHGAARGEVVNVYTSARVAPLVIGDGGGIYSDMVAYLNRKQLGQLSFKLIYLPRKRLQLQVERGELDGIVIGMMPHWFDDAAQKKYLWTAPFDTDRYVIVLPAGQAFNMSKPGALAGRTVGMVLGYSYPDLEDWMHQQGLVRSDAASDDHNLEKLRLGRVDSVAAAGAIVRYYMKVHAIDAGKFQLQELPSQLTERRFLVPHSKVLVYDRIAPVIRQLKDDPEWQRLKAKYE